MKITLNTAEDSYNSSVDLRVPKEKTNQPPHLQTVGTDNTNKSTVIQLPQSEALVNDELVTSTSATQKVTSEQNFMFQLFKLRMEQQKLKLEVEKERLVQEKIKTAKLKIELERKTGMIWTQDVEETEP